MKENKFSAKVTATDADGNITIWKDPPDFKLNKWAILRDLAIAIVVIVVLFLVLHWTDVLDLKNILDFSEAQIPGISKVSLQLAFIFAKTNSFL